MRDVTKLLGEYSNSIRFPFRGEPEKSFVCQSSFRSHPLFLSVLSFTPTSRWCFYKKNLAGERKRPFISGSEFDGNRVWGIRSPSRSLFVLRFQVYFSHSRACPPNQDCLFTIFRLSRAKWNWIILHFSFASIRIPNWFSWCHRGPWKWISQWANENLENMAGKPNWKKDQVTKIVDGGLKGCISWGREKGASGWKSPFIVHFIAILSFPPSFFFQSEALFNIPPLKNGVSRHARWPSIKGWGSMDLAQFNFGGIVGEWKGLPHGILAVKRIWNSSLFPRFLVLFLFRLRFCETLQHPGGSSDHWGSPRKSNYASKFSVF